MSALTRLHDLSLKLDSALEFARGDRAIDALKNIPPTKGRYSVKGADFLRPGEGDVPALRKNVKGVKRAIENFHGTKLTQEEAAAEMAGFRNSAARFLRKHRR